MGYSLLLGWLYPLSLAALARFIGQIPNLAKESAKIS
jgi:hypothetical protein